MPVAWNRHHRSGRRRARGVRVGTGAGQRTALHDEVLLADRTVSEVALQDLPGTRRVAGLGGQGRAGDVWRHAVVWHGAPRVVGRGRLRGPHVAGVTGELAALERTNDRGLVTDPRPC